MSLGNMQYVTTHAYDSPNAAVAKRAAIGIRLNRLPISPNRRFPRFQFHEHVRIGITKGDVPTYVEGRGVDLAEGGAGVTTSAKLVVGDTVHLQIPLAPGPLHLPARVCYHFGAEYGLEFVALGISEREYIRENCKFLMRVG
jgi:PilZ domain